MKRVFLSIVSLAILIFLPSCSDKEAIDIHTDVHKGCVSITPIPTLPLITAGGDSEIILSEKDKKNMGILIKWIYNSNLIHNGDDDSSIQLPDNINLYLHTYNY
jgi:hypothetical protein